jgi:hypothetical protein
VWWSAGIKLEVRTDQPLIFGEPKLNSHSIFYPAIFQIDGMKSCVDIIWKKGSGATAGGAAFEASMTFRVADPSWVSRGRGFDRSWKLQLSGRGQRGSVHI